MYLWRVYLTVSACPTSYPAAAAIVAVAVAAQHHRDGSLGGTAAHKGTDASAPVACCCRNEIWSRAYCCSSSSNSWRAYSSSS